MLGRGSQVLVSISWMSMYKGTPAWVSTMFSRINSPVTSAYNQSRSTWDTRVDKLTVRALGHIRSQNAGSLGAEQDARVGGRVDVGEVRLVGGVEHIIGAASLKELGI